MTDQPVLGNGRTVVPGPPVFVLCGSRSGSTLLRFVLDAHPELACPPETNLPTLCAQLATVWSLIEGAPLSPERGAEPPVVPAAAIAGIRHTVDLMIGSYLARRGGRRYCDKSLGTARFADLLLRVYPEARFVCLYRHPMDMIASGVEACPWGVAGYGFDPYVASSPGNTLLALARYWIDNTAAALSVEDAFPGSCFRVRYEDLVTDPEGTAAALFAFLGVAPAPGITGRCFSGDRERSGPSDYKIWHTAEVSAGSVGRGWAIPTVPIPDPVLEQLNELAVRLEYRPVDEEWGAAAYPGDVRAGVAPAAPEAAADGRPDAALALLADRLAARLDQVAVTGGAARWHPLVAVPFGVLAGGPAGQVGWRVDPAAGTVGPLDGDGDDTEWDVLGPAEAWQAVLGGGRNLGVALRRSELRYRDTGQNGVVGLAEARVDLLADLLGLASWPPAAGVDDLAAAGPPPVPAQR
jgi:protein-tyrosine sulfotransferase